jgi:anti-anti-sigma factor
MSSNEIIHGFDDEKNDSLKVSLKIPGDGVAPDTIRVVPTGMIDTYNCPFWTRQMGLVMKKTEFRKIWVDCSGVNYMSSVGIGSFTGFLKELRTQGKELIVSSIQPRVMEVFQLLGFGQFLDIQESEEAAIRKLNKVDASPFPVVKKCPICNRKFSLTKAGRFRCGGTVGCGTVLNVSPTALLTLG